MSLSPRAPRYDSMAALLADPNHPLRAHLPPHHAGRDEADRKYLAAYLRLKPHLTLPELVAQGIRERVGVAKRRDPAHVARITTIATAVWQDAHPSVAPIEEPEDAANSPACKPSGVTADDGASAVVLSAPPRADFQCLDTDGRPLDVTLARPTLTEALDEPVAWIRPGTQHELVYGTMQQCPTPELVEVAAMLQERCPSHTRLAKWRRARMAALVLAARELATNADAPIDRPPMAFTPAELITMAAAARREET